MKDAATSVRDRFLELLEPLERALETCARRLIWDQQDLEDALQNAVLRAFAAFDRYHEDASFRAWMFTILVREVFALNRKHARIARHEFQVEPEEIDELGEAGSATGGFSGGLSSMAIEEVLDQDLARALKTLTEPERAVLLLRAVGGFRYREIAQALEIPIGSVMGHLSRARIKMRRALNRLTPLSQPQNPL